MGGRHAGALTAILFSVTLLASCGETVPQHEPTDTVLQTLDAPRGVRIEILERAADTPDHQYCVWFSDGDGGGTMCRDAEDFDEPLIAFLPSASGMTAVVAIDPHRRIHELVAWSERGETRREAADGLSASVASVTPVESVRVLDADGRVLAELADGA